MAYFALNLCNNSSALERDGEGGRGGGGEGAERVFKRKTFSITNLLFCL